MPCVNRTKDRERFKCPVLTHTLPNPDQGYKPSIFSSSKADASNLCFSVVAGRTLHLTAESEEVRDAWVEALNGWLAEGEEEEEKEKEIRRGR